MTPPFLYLSPPDVDAADREALLAAFDSGWIAPLGPSVNELEELFAKYMGVPETAALSSGTAALHLGLLLLGVGAGDRVYVPTLTFAATANAVVYAGAQPVFLDCDETWTLDPSLLQHHLERDAAAGQLPAAVITVDLYGQPCDYASIVDICRRHEVPILEDAAEALGSRLDGRPVGGAGNLGVFSFNGNKIITTSGGGVLTASDPTLIQRARYLATQARQPVLHYEHTDVGYNYRLSNILAGLGCSQFARLDRKVRRRREIFDRYKGGLCDLIDFLAERPGSQSNRWLTTGTLKCDVAPEEVSERLKTLAIEARPVWKPMHQQPVFDKAPMFGGAVADSLFERGICLPSGSSMSDADVDRVIEAVKAVHA